MSNGAGAGSTGMAVGITVQWCPECHADRTVEVVRLATDPEPVTVCTECGAGVDEWLGQDLPELLQPRAATERLGAERGQGAA